MSTPRQTNNKGFNKTHESKNTEESDSEDDHETDYKKALISLGRDILVAVIVMIIIIGGLYWYTANWPPMVVIESNSMMHGGDSDVGIIDTGDLVLVKSISKRSEIKTYVQGEKSDYKTYGSYGDVIIFRKNGEPDTPVIHRAVVWIVYNESGHNYMDSLTGFGSFDVPSMNLYDVMKINIPNYIPKPNNLTIKFDKILLNFKRTGRTPHGGFLTKGDNNNGCDQESDLTDSKGRGVEPILEKWIVGKAEGELPWFGLIKLFIGGETDEPGKRAPPTSVNMLILSISLIIAIPIILDLTFAHLEKRKKKKREEREVLADQSRPGPGLAPKQQAFQQQQKQPPPSPSAQFDPKSRTGTGIGHERETYTGPTIQKHDGVSEQTQPQNQQNRLSKDDLLSKIK